MSFFRGAEDDSESRDLSASRNTSATRFDEEDHSINRVQTIGSGSIGRENDCLETTDTFSPSSAPATFHANALLHSLLEDRCMLEAMVELQAQGVHVDSKHHPQVKTLGSARYSRLVQDLGALNVIKRGIDSQQYSPLRQNYLDALSVLSRQSGTAPRPQMQKAASQMDMALPANLRKYATGTFDVGAIQPQLGAMTMAENRPSTFTMPSHYLHDDTKYAREFDEFSMIGKGGYGVVYHVKHKLDGGSYAVKKIPMGDERIRKIQLNGQREMDNMLLELQTLARLHHPNVVRYHTGWIEYANFLTSGTKGPIAGRRLLEPPPDTDQPQERDANVSGVEIQFQFDEDGVGNGDDCAGWGSNEMSAAIDDDQDIVFEYSEEHSRGVGKHIHDVDDQQSGSLSVQNSSYTENPLQKMRSRSTLASVDDEEIEVIPRNDDATSSSEPDTSAFTGGEGQPLKPCLALHIQMSLYSMTLTDFLSTKDGSLESSTISSLRHCFHPSASLTILLAVMDGVKYLHREGIVHRDMKPGNIFLAVRPGSDCPPGAVDLSLCDHCMKVANPRPFNMDVCIGDFGLVSAIADMEDKAPSTPSRIVGTEIYRPERITRDNHPCLDVYALGVIAFELFWRFDTRMERHEVLHGLKRGEFPFNFEEKVGCVGLEKFVESMVRASDLNCPTWETLKIQAHELKEMNKA